MNKYCSSYDLLSVGEVLHVSLSWLRNHMLQCWETFAKKRVTVTQICIMCERRTCIQAAGSGLIIKSFPVLKPEVPRNTWDVWSQFQSTPLRSSNPSPSNFRFHGKSCPVYFELYYSPLIWGDVTGLVNRQTKRWPCSKKNYPINLPTTLLSCWKVQHFKKNVRNRHLKGRRKQIRMHHYSMTPHSHQMWGTNANGFTPLKSSSPDLHTLNLLFRGLHSLSLPT